MRQIARHQLLGPSHNVLINDALWEYTPGWEPNSDGVPAAAGVAEPKFNEPKVEGVDVEGVVAPNDGKKLDVVVAELPGTPKVNPAVERPAEVAGPNENVGGFIFLPPTTTINNCLAKLTKLFPSEFESFSPYKGKV